MREFAEEKKRGGVRLEKGGRGGEIAGGLRAALRVWLARLGEEAGVRESRGGGREESIDQEARGGG